MKGPAVAAPDGLYKSTMIAYNVVKDACTPRQLDKANFALCGLWRQVGYIVSALIGKHSLKHDCNTVA